MSREGLMAHLTAMKSGTVVLKNMIQNALAKRTTGLTTRDWYFPLGRSPIMMLHRLSSPTSNVTDVTDGTNVTDVMGLGAIVNLARGHIHSLPRAGHTMRVCRPLPLDLPNSNSITQGDPSQVSSSGSASTTAGSGQKKNVAYNQPDTYGRGRGMAFFTVEFTPVITSCRSTCFLSPARTWYVVLHHGIYGHNIL